MQHFPDKMWTQLFTHTDIGLSVFSHLQICCLLSRIANTSNRATYALQAVMCFWWRCPHVDASIQCPNRVYKPCSKRWHNSTRSGNPSDCSFLEAADGPLYHKTSRDYCEEHAQSIRLARRTKNTSSLAREERAERVSKKTWTLEFHPPQSGGIRYLPQDTTQGGAIPAYHSVSAAQGAYAQPQPNDPGQQARFQTHTLRTAPPTMLPTSSNTLGVRHGDDLSCGFEFPFGHAIPSSYAFSPSLELPSDQPPQDYQRSNQRDIPSNYDRDFRESSYEPLAKYIYASSISGPNEDIVSRKSDATNRQTGVAARSGGLENYQNPLYDQPLPTLHNFETKGRQLLAEGRRQHRTQQVQWQMASHDDFPYTKSKTPLARRHDQNILPVPPGEADLRNQEFVFETLAPGSQASLNESLQQTATLTFEYVPRLVNQGQYTIYDPPPDPGVEKRNRKTLTSRDSRTT